MFGVGMIFFMFLKEVSYNLKNYSNCETLLQF